MSFPRYPRYKPSGVEWLREVPEHWSVIPLKRVLRLENGADHKPFEADDGFPVIGSGGQFAWATQFMFDGESVLLGRKGTIDRPLYVNGPFWTVDTMYWSRIHPCASARFCYYAALTIPFGMYSTNTALPSMTKSDLESHAQATPPLAEQRAIAAFLDRETAKIDALIAEQEKLIELLAEKRQAVISHAVTKGLNPAAPMKPSGIEWLGDVPEHWQVVQFRRCIISIEQGWSPECEADAAGIGQWGVLKVGCVNDEQFDPRENKGLPEGNTPPEALEVRAGDLLMSRGNTEELVGMAATASTSDSRLLLSDLLYRVHLNPELAVSSYFAVQLRSIGCRHQIRCLSTGTSASMKKVSQADIRNISVAVPPLNEQAAITQELNQLGNQARRARHEASTAVALLRERRSALISAAVTGQIDVRNAVPENAA